MKGQLTQDLGQQSDPARSRVCQEGVRNEETVDAVALREELRRAQARIQDFDLFRKEEMDNDLNVPGALSVIFDFLRYSVRLNSLSFIFSLSSSLIEMTS